MDPGANCQTLVMQIFIQAGHLLSHKNPGLHRSNPTKWGIETQKTNYSTGIGLDSLECPHVPNTVRQM